MQAELKRAAFVVPGEPIGKGRPRFVKATGRTYTPGKTAAYENLVKLEYERACTGKRFGDYVALKMRVRAYYSVPTSTSKRKQAQMTGGLLRPMKKPDASNVLKAIEDGLNGVAYRDDAQIVHVEVEKWFSDIPRVEVEIWTV